ncbi:MAG: serine hydrolase [Saprospiraceae bacterium]|nr:serine hydrolase [Saprospiraceae bacterium]
MRILMIVLFLLYFTINSYAQVLNPKIKKSSLRFTIDSILNHQVDEDMIPGAVIQIKQGNKILYRKAYGFAQKYDYQQQLLARPEKMSLRHVFDLASLTKVIATTSAIMILVDRGVIKLDNPINEYLPGFDSMDKKTITVRHLLTHTSGLTEWYPMYYRADNKQKTYKLIESLPLKYPVGAERHYSDLGFVLLGQIVEEVTRLPFEVFLQKALFGPLHMNKTGFNPLKNKKNKKIAATSHGNPYEKRMVYDSTLGFTVKEIDPASWNGWRTYTLKGEVNDGNAWYANRGISGAAGLFSSAKDLQKLLDQLMGKSKYPRIISKKTINTFLTRDSFDNGLGWMMDPANSFIKNGPEGSYGHTGFTGTCISVIPSHDISIILLVNRQNKGLLSTGNYYNVSPLRQRLVEVVLNLLN